MSLISQNAAGVKAGLREEKKKKQQQQEVEEEEGMVLINGSDGEENGRMVVVEEEKKKRKRRRERKEDEEQIQRETEKISKLEDALFGSLYSKIEVRGSGEDEVGDDGGGEDDGKALFYTDRSGNGLMVGYEEEGGLEMVDVEGSGGKEKRERKPVWEDEEEKQVSMNIAKVNRVRKLRKEEGETVIDGAEYVARLRAHHVKMNPSTEWAKLDGKGKRSYDDSDNEGSDEEEMGAVVAREYRDVADADDILRSNESLVTKSRTKLLPGRLEYSRMVDVINKKEKSGGVISSVQFHKNAQLLLTAGLDRKLRFFQIDGKRNKRKK